MDESILTSADLDEMESYLGEETGDFEGLLECIAKKISDGLKVGRFTDSQVKSDLELALWIAYACNNIGDYEHYSTSCKWLAGVEDRAAGCGTWFCRYADALMYCGKPGRALEYAARGVVEEPAYPWCWLILARLRAHFGDMSGAIQAAEKGNEINPSPEFELMIEQIGKGMSLEEMEIRTTLPGTDYTLETAFESDEPEARLRAEAVMGIVTDHKELRNIKDLLNPSGWIPDHPFCTYMMPYGERQILITLTMNEAYLSKMSGERIRNIVDSLPELERTARERLLGKIGDKALYGLTIDRRMQPMLSFGDFEDESPTVVQFDENLNILQLGTEGGPFIAIVLLSDDSVDFEEIKRNLQSEWGIRCGENADADSLIFESDGHLAAFSLVHGQVPDNEAVENARNNYLWDGAEDAARKHRAHLLVALINHSGSPVDAAIMHTQMVSAACLSDNVLGVYFQGTVVKRESFIEEAMTIKDMELPVSDWIWVGVYRTEDGRTNAYTSGMNVFGRDELEFIDSDGDPEEVRDILYDICHYVLENNIVLTDDSVIGFEGDRRYRVTHSPGISVEGITVKIERISP